MALPPAGNALHSFGRFDSAADSCCVCPLLQRRAHAPCLEQEHACRACRSACRLNYESASPGWTSPLVRSNLICGRHNGVLGTHKGHGDKINQEPPPPTWRTVEE